MTEKAIIKATYADYKRVQGRKVLQVICEVPLEQAPEVHKLFGEPSFGDGALWVAIAKLDTRALKSETPVTRTYDPVEEEDKPKRIMSSAQMAGMLCADELFQSFVQTKSYFSPTQDKGEQTADYVREFCRVKSRAELSTSTKAFRLWCDLNAEYEAWKLCP